MAMKVGNFSIGQMVRFAPKCENIEDNYTLSGVQVGDVGVVTGPGFDEQDEDVVVDFIRQDGTICEGFYAFREDLEAVND